MAHFIFVRTTDASSRDLFCELLRKNDYKTRWPLVEVPADRLIVRICYEAKTFELFLYAYGDCLSVEEFEDLFL